MNVPWDRIEALSPEHDLSAFSSGRDSIDTWFRESALKARNYVSTHVCIAEEHSVCAFFSLRATRVNTEGMPSRMRSSADRDGWVFAILLARMGVCSTEQGKGYGRALFWEAVEKARVADAAIRVPLFVVDAADYGLIPFYESFGMKRIPDTPRLVALINKI